MDATTSLQNKQTETFKPEDPQSINSKRFTILGFITVRKLIILSTTFLIFVFIDYFILISATSVIYEIVIVLAQLLIITFLSAPVLDNYRQKNDMKLIVK